MASIIATHHPGGGYDRDCVRLARQYAEATGFGVVCIDAIAHGDRVDTPKMTPAPGIPREWPSSGSARIVQAWQAAGQALASIGPAHAYVALSMGAIFGVPTVAAISSSMVPSSSLAASKPRGIDDPPLGPLLEVAATRLEHC